MGGSDWWRIGTLALHLPIERCRLLLKCAVVPIVVHFALLAMVGFAGQDSWLNQWPTADFAILPALDPILPWLLLEWCWMNALWHDEEEQTTKFVRNALFWRYVALFVVVHWAKLAGWLFLSMALELVQNGFAAARSVPVIKSLLAALLPIIVLGLLGLWIWILLRFVIWNAATIDRRRILGPTAIWHMTRGYGAQIFLVFLVVGFVVGGAHVVLIYILSLDVTTVADTFSLADIILLPLEFYAVAAFGAATLLVYSRISGGSIPAPGMAGKMGR